MDETEDEIGRELKVSELTPQTVVVLSKPDSKWRPMITHFTAWVVSVSPDFVFFWAGVGRVELALIRTGPDLEHLTDMSDRPIHVYEYKGQV